MLSGENFKQLSWGTKQVSPPTFQFGFRWKIMWVRRCTYSIILRNHRLYFLLHRQWHTYETFLTSLILKHHSNSPVLEHLHHLVRVNVIPFVDSRVRSSHPFQSLCWLWYVCNANLRFLFATSYASDCKLGFTKFLWFTMLLQKQHLSKAVSTLTCSNLSSSPALSENVTAAYFKFSDSDDRTMKHVIVITVDIHLDWSTL